MRTTSRDVRFELAQNQRHHEQSDYAIRKSTLDNWLIRLVALFCGAGAAGLLWTFGVFVVVPWRAGRLLSLNGAEWQILAMSDQAEHPTRYALLRTVWIVTCLGAMVAGIFWSLARLP